MTKHRTTASKTRVLPEAQDSLYSIAVKAAQSEDPTQSLIDSLDRTELATRKHCGFVAGVLYALERFGQERSI